MLRIWQLASREAHFTWDSQTPCNVSVQQGLPHPRWQVAASAPRSANGHDRATSALSGISDNVQARQHARTRSPTGSSCQIIPRPDLWCRCNESSSRLRRLLGRCMPGRFLELLGTPPLAVLGGLRRGGHQSRATQVRRPALPELIEHLAVKRQRCPLDLLSIFVP